MKTLTITITVPDGVDVQVQQGTPATVPSSAPDAPLAQSWPAGSCPKHGPDRWAESKFGGFYCTAKDDSQHKGYCTLKSGIVFNGKRIPA